MKPLPNVDEQYLFEYSETEGKVQSTEPFVKIVKPENIQTVIEILKNRLPNSGHVYNMALMSAAFPRIEIYSYQAELTRNSILMLKHFREDFGQEICISVPLDFKASDPVKEAFINTSVIDWSEKYCFPAIQRPLSAMILEISTVFKKNSTVNNPNYYYYVSQEDAAAYEIKSPPPGVTVGPLDENGAKFLTDNWKYSFRETHKYTKDIVENGMSSGVHMDGNPVCGIIVNPNGLIGMLYTEKNHRNAGYAKICTNNLIKQLGVKGFVVASCVECNNVVSNKFHEKLGMKLVHICDYVMYLKLGFEAK